jgi:hypothetical protein
VKLDLENLVERLENVRMKDRQATWARALVEEIAPIPLLTPNCEETECGEN